VRLPITATAICRPGYRGMFACGFHHSNTSARPTTSHGRPSAMCPTNWSNCQS